MSSVHLAPAPSAAPPAGPMTPARHRVVSRRLELSDTVTLELAPVDEPLPPAAPGQFLMLWAPGVGEVPISVSAAPAPDGTIGHTVRAVGAVTRALCASEPGSMLGVRGPFGSPWPIDAARGRDLLVVAGGIGFAPLRPVVDLTTRERDSFGRVSVLVGARQPDQILFVDELRRWGADHDVDVELTVDTAGPDWNGHVGVVTRLVPASVADGATTTALVCGPEPMMRFTALALVDAAVAPTDIHVSLERNMACAIAQCGHCQLGPVFVCRSGPVVDWDVARSLLEVRER